MRAERVERIGPATLILGDSEALRGAPDGLPAWDALCSDPPWGVKMNTAIGDGDTRSKVGAGRLQGGCRAAFKVYPPCRGDDRPFDAGPWLAHGRPALFWGANHFAASLPRGRWLVWDKREHLASNDQSDAELGWTNAAGLATRIHRQYWSGVVRRADFWRTGAAGSRRQHPMEKPVQLMAWSLRQMRLAAGASVLDPYMGVGTTVVAAMLLGHPVTGVEIEPQYFDVACERVSLIAADPDIWREKLVTA